MPKETRVLFEHTWQEAIGDDASIVKVARFVGWYFEGEQGKIGALHWEELTEDAMGNTVWMPVEDSAWLPREPIAALLQLAGRLPAEDDLSCLR